MVHLNQISGSNIFRFRLDPSRAANKVGPRSNFVVWKCLGAFLKGQGWHFDKGIIIMMISKITSKFLIDFHVDGFLLAFYGTKKPPGLVESSKKAHPATQLFPLSLISHPWAGRLRQAPFQRDGGKSWPLMRRFFKTHLLGASNFTRNHQREPFEFLVKQWVVTSNVSYFRGRLGWKPPGVGWNRFILSWKTRWRNFRTGDGGGELNVEQMKDMDIVFGKDKRV